MNTDNEPAEFKAPRPVTVHHADRQEERAANRMKGRWAAKTITTCRPEQNQIVKDQS